ncbi:MAG: hypothetical protein QOF69_111 [Solirubrobacteraceae bacterium]|jgi:hypothetical protein|nr:hypothetical protein [Solirubrobacteraceae bacterium]
MTAAGTAESDAILTLVRFMRERHDRDQLRDETPADRLLMLTTQRSTNTASAVANLLSLDAIEQAQMLCRSLFEDMAVMHWLVMQDDADFLIDRFFDSQDAIALYEHEVATREMGFPRELPSWIGDAESRRDELRLTFGIFAQHPWWGAGKNRVTSRHFAGRRPNRRRCPALQAPTLARWTAGRLPLLLCSRCP